VIELAANEPAAFLSGAVNNAGNPTFEPAAGELDFEQRA
jgi:hypothetical protein